MATIKLRRPDGHIEDIPVEAELAVFWPGVPPKTIRLRDLATVMGDPDVWLEVERRLVGL